MPMKCQEAAGAAAVSFSSQGTCSCHRAPLISVTTREADLTPRATGGCSPYIITPSLLGCDWKSCALLQFSRLAEGPAGAEPMGTGV